MTDSTFQGFNHSTRKNMEDCSLSYKEIQDKKFSSYRTATFNNNNDRNGFMKSLDHIGISASKNKDGYEKIIDMESKLKQSSITNYKDKQQLQSRGFKGSPFMGAGETHIVNPVLYSKLMSGNDTRVKKAADTLAGVSIDRFIPLVPCLQENIQNPEHIIPQYWVRGGESSRSYIQNIDYYKLCGIKKE
jgi:hypothetical protein